MWGTKFKPKGETSNIENIVKSTLDIFADNYKRSVNKREYQNTDQTASRFILGVIPNKYNEMLAYYDFKKEVD